MIDLKILLKDPSKPKSKLGDTDIDVDFSMGGRTFVRAKSCEMQRAYIASYIKKGTIQGQPDKGIDWASLPMQRISYAEIAAQINRNLSDYIGDGKYMPTFSEKDGRFLLVEVR
jgi:hypothetical protein